MLHYGTALLFFSFSSFVQNLRTANLCHKNSPQHGVPQWVQGIQSSLLPRFGPDPGWTGTEVFRATNSNCICRSCQQQMRRGANGVRGSVHEAPVVINRRGWRSLRTGVDAWIL